MPSHSTWDAIWPLGGLVVLIVLAIGILSFENNEYPAFQIGELNITPLTRGGFVRQSYPVIMLGDFLPTQKLNLSPQQALRINLARPVNLDNGSAIPFPGDRLNSLEFSIASECLTGVIYYEARSENVAGQIGVAQVVLNRVRHPNYPKSVCAVVNQGGNRSTGCQFTFTCDGSLRRQPIPAAWQHAKEIANAMLRGMTSQQVGQATHYHTIWIVPVWASELQKVAIIGNHIFYRPPASYGDFSFIVGRSVNSNAALAPPNVVSLEDSAIAKSRPVNPSQDEPHTADGPRQILLDKSVPMLSTTLASPSVVAKPQFGRAHKKANLAVPSE